MGDERKQGTVDPAAMEQQAQGSKPAVAEAKRDESLQGAGAGRPTSAAQNQGKSAPPAQAPASSAGEEKKPEKPARVRPVRKSAGQLLKESNRAACEARDLFEDVKRKNAEFLREALEVLCTAKVSRGYYEGNGGAKPLPNDRKAVLPNAPDDACELKVGFCFVTKRSRALLKEYAERVEELKAQVAEYAEDQCRTEQAILSALDRLLALETVRLRQKTEALQKQEQELGAYRERLTKLQQAQEQELGIYRDMLAEILQIQGQDKKKKNLIDQIDRFSIARNTLTVIRNICDAWGGSDDLQYGKYMLEKIRTALAGYEKALKESEDGGLGN